MTEKNKMLRIFFRANNSTPDGTAESSLELPALNSPLELSVYASAFLSWLFLN